MPFHAYIPVGFAHSHESRMFEQLAKVLAARFGSGGEPVYLIGNAMFDDNELDAVLLNGDALFVIDMKDYGGLIHFSENAEWYVDDIEVKSGFQPSPSRLRSMPLPHMPLPFFKRTAPKPSHWRRIVPWPRNPARVLAAECGISHGIRPKDSRNGCCT